MRELVMVTSLGTQWAAVKTKFGSKMAPPQSSLLTITRACQGWELMGFSTWPPTIRTDSAKPKIGEFHLKLLFGLNWSKHEVVKSWTIVHFC